MDFDDFMIAAPPQSDELNTIATTSSFEPTVETHGPQITNSSIEDEENVKQEIYNATYNEQALTRRRSYQDLCESIMGVDCEECKDGARLLDEIMKHDSIQPGGFPLLDHQQL